jgi:hypothetical protein
MAPAQPSALKKPSGTLSAKKTNPAFKKKIEKLKLTLAPLVPLPNGPPHSSYPKTVLHFWLLTEEQLDKLAHYYHQSTPCQYTNEYPANMNWDTSFFVRASRIGRLSEERRIAIKRRKLGKFIGLVGCETPLEELQFKLDLLQAELSSSVQRMEQGTALPARKWV